MKDIKNLIEKFLVFTFLLIACISTSIVANASNASNKNISPGTYECENNVKHNSEIGTSMARTYTNKKMKIEVYKNKVDFTIGFSGAEYMKNFRILINGKETSINSIKRMKKIIQLH